MVSTIISCRGAEADSLRLAVQQTIVLPLLQYIDKAIAVFVQVQQVLGGSLWRQSRSHSCSSLIVDTGVAHARRCATTDAHGR